MQLPDGSSGQQTIVRAQECVQCGPVLGSFHFFSITVRSASWKQMINQNDFLVFFFLFLKFQISGQGTSFLFEKQLCTSLPWQVLTFMTQLYTTNSLETFFNILELQGSRSGISSGGSLAAGFLQWGVWPKEW